MLFPVQITLTDLFNFIIYLPSFSDLCSKHLFPKSHDSFLALLSLMTFLITILLFTSETCLNVIFNTSLFFIPTKYIRLC